MIALLAANLKDLRTVCERHEVSELFAFGSAVYGAFHEKSDLNFAVLFHGLLNPIAHGDAFFGLKDDLAALFKRPVDLVSYRVLKNHIFKSELDKTKVSL